jgi:hypothetical protein
MLVVNNKIFRQKRSYIRSAERLILESNQKNQGKGSLIGVGHLSALLI